MGSSISIKNHQQPKDFINWFEIPVYNIERAAAFYNAIYNMQMETNINGDYAMAFFPAEKRRWRRAGRWSRLQPE